MQAFFASSTATLPPSSCRKPNGLPLPTAARFLSSPPRAGFFMRYDFDLTRIPDDLLWSGVTVRGRSDAGSAIYCHYHEGGRGFGLSADEARRNWRNLWSMTIVEDC